MANQFIVKNGLVVVSNGATITGSVDVTGDLVVGGDITAKTLIISSSVTHFTQSFSSGSTKFGDSLDDRHELTGSVNITGSLHLNGTLVEIYPGQTKNLTVSAPSTTWSFNHGFNFRYPTVNVYDSAGYVVIPKEIKAVDENNLEVYFTSGQTGIVVATIGGNNASVLSGTSGSSGTSGIATINNNTNNNVLTATGTSGVIQGESNMTFNGSILSITGDTSITGNLTAGSKSFDIPHPTKEGWRLKYGVLEGPEHAVYLRGRATSEVIELPDYWVNLIDENTITVQLTSIGKLINYCVKEIKENKIFISTKSGNIDCFYFIQAERKDIDKIITEYEL